MTRRYVVAFVMAVMICTLPFLFGKPAKGATQEIVMVEETVTGTWDKALRESITNVDKLTGKTRMVLGKCVADVKCIKVKNAVTPAGTVGICYDCDLTYFTARIELNNSWTGDKPRRHLATHELAHAFGLAHNPLSTSLMYRRMTKLNGQPVPYVFIASEITYLKGK